MNQKLLLVLAFIAIMAGSVQGKLKRLVAVGHKMKKGKILKVLLPSRTSRPIGHCRPRLEKNEKCDSDEKLKRINGPLLCC